MPGRIWITLGAATAAAFLATAVRASAHERRRDRHEREEHEEREERGEREAYEQHDERERFPGRRRDGGEGGPAGGQGPASGMLPSYAKECGSCHLAFPPNLLPAASWARMMAGLDRHFGKNAELEPEVRDPIERWLVERAGSREDGGSLRFTEGSWFRRKHRKVEGKVSRPSIRSIANCAACHPRAERWDFDEDGIVIPPR